MSSSITSASYDGNEGGERQTQDLPPLGKLVKVWKSNRNSGLDRTAVVRGIHRRLNKGERLRRFICDGQLAGKTH